MSTLLINASDTVGSDSGLYRCQVTVRITRIVESLPFWDFIDYFDTSRVTLTGNVLNYCMQYYCMTMVHPKGLLLFCVEY